MRFCSKISYWNIYNPALCNIHFGKSSKAIDNSLNHITGTYPIMLHWRLLAIVIVSITVFSTNAQIKELDYFNKIRLYSDINIVCVQSPDSIGRISYDKIGDTNDPIVTMTVNDVLTIYTKDVDTEVKPDTIYVLYPELISVDNAYNSTMVIRAVHSNGKFKVILQGNGKIEIEDLQVSEASFSIITGCGTIEVKNGLCQTAHCRLLGTGKIILDNLYSDNVTLRCLGTGTIYCPITKKISARGFGSTKIYYVGNPVIKRRGNAKVFKIDE